MVFTYSNLGVLPLRLSLVGLGLWLLCPSHWPDPSPSPPDEPSIFIFSSVRRLHLLFSNLHFCSEAASLMGSCQECSNIPHKNLSCFIFDQVTSADWKVGLYVLIFIDAVVSHSISHGEKLALSLRVLFLSHAFPALTYFHAWIHKCTHRFQTWKCFNT